MMDEKFELEFQWGKLNAHLTKQFGKPADLNAVLFLIGVRELGVVKEFTKEQKQDLMHIATCRVLSEDGYYELEHLDQDGWPHWKQIKPLPVTTATEQEWLLKKNILSYFREMDLYQ